MGEKNGKAHCTKVENQVNLMRGMTKKLLVELDMLASLCESSTFHLNRMVNNFLSELEQVPRKEKNYILSQKMDESSTTPD